MNKGLKTIATIVSLLVIYSALVAGVVDTRSRVEVLERDGVKQYVQFEQIKGMLHKIDKEQVALRQRVEDLIERLKMNGR